MNHRIGLCYFSPTNTTRRILEAIASGMGEQDPKVLNITLPATRNQILTHPDPATSDIDHLIVGAPVYNGKIPLQVIEVLKVLKGAEKQCSIVAVYGNRDYGIALKQMAELLQNRGFLILAAAAFIGQHSYSDVIPVAMGRPDQKDLKQAEQFGLDILQQSHNLTEDELPVQLDMFSKSDKYTPLKPVYLEDACTQCGECEHVCPTGIIAPETGKYIHDKAEADCIGCMACVRECSYESRRARPGFFMKHLMRFILRKAAQQRLEPLVIFKPQPVQAT